MKKHILSVIFLLSVLILNAQTNAFSGYFLDNFLYRFQMNPAFGNEENFVGFPALGNLSTGTQGTLPLSKIIYPLDGKTVLFTHPGLTDVKSFPKSNKIGANIRENLINVGFNSWGGYNSLSISTVENSQITAPGSLLNMLREGVSNQNYDIKNFMISANAYAEIALNHSREIKQIKGLRVGATFKFLIGIANIYGKFKRADLSLGENSWDIMSEAELFMSMKGLEWKTKSNKYSGNPYVSGADYNKFGLNGFGAAIDFGATYKWEDFNFSLAFLDLGGISWTETKRASTNGLQTFKTDKYIFEVNGDNNAWDDLKEDITDVYQLQPDNSVLKRSTMQGATMNVGVEYELPYYRNLTFGLLNTTRMSGNYTWTEFRVSANVVPVRYVGASANLVCGTFGVGFGWLVNFTTGKGFNVFLGMDRTPGKLTKQYVPLNSNVNLNFGLNFPF